MLPYEPDQYAPAYSHVTPLPRPGGPVDIGIDRAAQIARGITPLPRPDFQEAGVLSVGGGGGGGAYSPDPWARPALTPKIMEMVQQLRQQFPTPIQQRVPPGQARMKAVHDAHMQAIERMQKYQHQRRFSGRRP